MSPPPSKGLWGKTTRKKNNKTPYFGRRVPHGCSGEVTEESIRGLITGVGKLRGVVYTPPLLNRHRMPEPQMLHGRFGERNPQVGINGLLVGRQVVANAPHPSLGRVHNQIITTRRNHSQQNGEERPDAEDFPPCVAQ